MVVVGFHPRSGVDNANDDSVYIKLFQRLRKNGCYGVLRNHDESAEDGYLVPVAKNEPIPGQLLPFCGPGLGQNRRDLLLGVMWRERPDVRAQQAGASSRP
jgi:hypothetical protein